MSRAFILRSVCVVALVCAPVTVHVALAQDLPPELTGDYSELPPPPPSPPRTAAPTRPQQQPQPRPQPQLRDRQPVPEEPPIDPELGDVGPAVSVAPELSDEPAATEPESTEDATAPVEDVDVSESDEPTAPLGRPRFYLGLGLGAGTLSFSRPAAGGTQVLPTTPYAAADLDLRVHIGHANALSWEALFLYQTSVGFVLERSPLFALPEDIAVRVQRFVLSLGPRLRLSDSLALVLPLGFGMQLFTPKSHQYDVDAYALGGLSLRPEVVVAVSERVTLRVGAEALWLFLFNPSLKQEGACCSGGALGAQATLQTTLGGAFSLALTYRELRTLIPVAARFSATERVVTARLVGEL